MLLTDTSCALFEPSGVTMGGQGECRAPEFQEKMSSAHNLQVTAVHNY